ncbi:MAG: hypothetical protein HeimC3_26490 [Candidatus Heimdallarchaeota archaeon LC_3]|nr:MAG: hypothetical protein HeimC3_26490 [Candidatus Heimdallarchaeota archaeon LC_3]
MWSPELEGLQNLSEQSGAGKKISPDGLKIVTADRGEIKVSELLSGKTLLYQDKRTSANDLFFFYRSLGLLSISIGVLSIIYTSYAKKKKLGYLFINPKGYVEYLRYQLSRKD